MLQPSALLAVVAHPDDEALLAGGVLARHTARGARTAVVTATWAPDTQRAAELADSLEILGAGQPRMLGYADHRVPESAPGRPRLCDAPFDQVVEDVVRHIRAVRPETVITHDAYGQLTGHPDHRQTHRATLLAVAAAGLAHLYPDTGEPWQPTAVHLATHPHSAVADLGPLLTRAAKSVLSVPDDTVDLTVDVRPWLDRKWAAITAHRSQVERDRPLPGLLSRLPRDARDRILATEYYTRLTFRPAPNRPTGSVQSAGLAERQPPWPEPDFDTTGEPLPVRDAGDSQRDP
ncbi:PIG-L deacetylase family protein [Kitasatospora sp. NPDC004723]|uniref:PIG-L deacetylase family protein n=1 Tax=Kitasatospora sp. NPDC004723 TaxID=3154288 RepID=UPI0033A7BFEF